MTIVRKLRQLSQVTRDVRWWPFYLQRRFMGTSSRARLAHWAVKLRPKAAFTHTATEPVQRGLSGLQRSGIAQLGRLLSAEQCTELRAYFETKLAVDTYRPEYGRFLPTSDARFADSHIAYHDAEDIVTAPYLLALANDPMLIEIVARYLGCRPTLGYLAVWWSYHTGVGAQHAENFHRDVDDWRFVKLFIYLSDVGVENGPHVYVTHSVSSSRLREIERFSDDEVARAFGDENVLRLVGDAGTGFLEDTFGIHKGQPVLRGRRLMFQAVYSMYPLPYGPKQPVIALSQAGALHAVKIDPWINRLYAYS
jgi:hypothetical protein